MMARNLIRGFLAAGPHMDSLPYPRMPHGAQRVVRDAIRYAWNELSEISKREVLAQAPEPEITAALQLALNRLLDDEDQPVPGFTSNHFEIVERGAECVDFSGSHLEKRPDLRFRMQGRINGVRDRTHHALFTECKIIDATHPLRRYGSDGVARFVNGEYAWAVQHAMMVAYVRDDKVGLPSVVTLLTTAANEFNVLGTELSPKADDPVLESVHERTWRYLSTTTPPGPITLVHVWLNLN